MLITNFSEERKANEEDFLHINKK